MQIYICMVVLYGTVIFISCAVNSYLQWYNTWSQSIFYQWCCTKIFSTFTIFFYTSWNLLVINYKNKKTCDITTLCLLGRNMVQVEKTASTWKYLNVLNVSITASFCAYDIYQSKNIVFFGNPLDNWCWTLRGHRKDTAVSLWLKFRSLTVALSETWAGTVTGKHPDGKCSCGKSETVKTLQPGCIKYREIRVILSVFCLLISDTEPNFCGVQQGSIFDPVLFALSYVSLSIFKRKQKHCFCYH